MITAFNNTNSEQYKLDLFAKAQQALRDHYNDFANRSIHYDENVVIATLNDYFCYIEYLYEIDPKFTVLPLDEETFNIDANTRAINIPVAFKKNGLGVQGDNYAETIYFMVDRYFDNMDLAAPDMQIQIQYEVFDDKGRPVKKDIPAIIKDTEKIQNKLLFGWQINNDVTERAGNVRFGVRFYKVDEITHEVIYSLSTLTATIGINQALDFDVADFNQDDPTEALKRRLTNSIEDGATIATAPIFVINLPFEHGATKVDLHDADELAEANPDKETYTFTVLAHSNDEGAITYEWYKNNTKITEGPEMIKVLTKDTTAKPEKAYWYQDGGEFKYWVPNSTAFDAQDLYEDRAAFEIDGVGIYKVRAKNTIKTSTEYLDSNTIEVPGPTTPINVIAETQKVLADFDEGETVDITIHAEKGDAGDAEVSYKWYKVNDNPNIAEPEDFTPEADADILGTEATYSATGRGWYTAMIVGNRNKATVEFDSNKFYRVTDLPETEFTLEFDPHEAKIAIDEIATVEVVMPNRDVPRYDELMYQWYRLAQDGVKTAIEGFNTDTFDPAGDPAREFRGATITCGVKAVYNDMVGEEIFPDEPIEVTELGDDIRPEGELE